MTNEMKISTILKDLGISPSIKGYYYLRYAVEAMIEDNSLLHNVCGRLYPLIATRFETTKQRVERAMRHAIESGWINGNIETQQRMFGYTINKHKGNPTVSEFVATVMDWILLEEKAG